MNPNSALPVDPHNPNQWAFIQGLPNNVPFIPPVNCNPRLMPYLQIIAGNALLAAQSHAGRNPLRTMYFNLLSVSNYQNPNYPELVQACAELTDYLMATQHKDVHTAAREAAETMNSVMASMQMEKYPAIKALLNGEVINGSQQWLQHFQQLAAEISRFTQPMAYAGGPANPYGPPAPAPPAVNPQQLFAAASSFWDTSGMSRPGGGSGLFLGGLTTVPPKDDNLSEVGLFHDRPDPVLVRNDAVTSFNSTPPAPAPAAVPQEEGPDTDGSRKRAFDQLVLDDGSVIVPASQSRWTVSHTPEHPYRKAYHPSVYCLFHGMRPDNTIEEVLVPWHESNQMDYLKHELNSDLRQQLPKDPHAPKIVPNYDLLRFMSPVTDNLLAVDETLAEKAEEGGLEPIEAVTQVNIGFSDSLERLITAGTLERELIKEEGEGELVACAEIYGDLVEPMVCEESDIARLLEVRRCTMLLDVMACMDEDVPVSDSVRQLINQRLTDEINVGLKYNLQLDGYRIDSFQEDYVDLLGVLEESFGKGLIEVLKAQEAGIIGRALNVLTGERLSQYLSKAHGEKAVDKLSRRTLVFTDRVGVTYVEWNSADMDLAFTGSGAISEVDMPELYAAVKAMFERTAASDLPFAHHLMRTKDGLILEFHRGWLGKDFFLVSKF